MGLIPYFFQPHALHSGINELFVIPWTCFVLIFLLPPIFTPLRTLQNALSSRKYLENFHSSLNLNLKTIYYVKCSHSPHSNS